MTEAAREGVQREEEKKANQGRVGRVWGGLTEGFRFRFRCHLPAEWGWGGISGFHGNASPL